MTLNRKQLGLVAALVLALCTQGAHAAEWAKVRRVNDGDTVELTDGRLVRYIGVDTPEIHHERQTADPFALAARTLNADLVAARRIRLEFDLERFDSYGRTLAYVFLPDGVMVNAALLRSGLAFCMPRQPNVRHADLLLREQREAMQARRGMWRDWREEEGRYVGNRSSRRFHLAGCPEAARISPRNRVAFKSRWEAFWAGYAPSRECVNITADPNGPP